MTESTCDNYLAKYNELISACGSVDTTLIQFQTLVNELKNLEIAFNTDEILFFNVTYQLKYMNVKILTMTKLQLLKSFISFVKLREKHTNNYDQSTEYDEMILYSKETLDIIEYIDTIINSCVCLGSLQYLML